MKKSRLIRIKFKTIAPLIIAFACMPLSNVNAATVTFDGVADWPGSSGVYQEAGFDFTSTTGFFSGSYVNGFVGLKASPSSWTVTRTSGGAFDAIGLDISNPNGAVNQTFTFTGTFAGGGNITQSFTATPFSSAPVTATLSGFNSLSSLSVNAYPFDNLVANPVPLPAAAWLFGSGLLGLVGIARRKKAA